MGNAQTYQQLVIKGAKLPHPCACVRRFPSARNPTASSRASASLESALYCKAANRGRCTGRIAEPTQEEAALAYA